MKFFIKVGLSVIFLLTLSLTGGQQLVYAIPSDSGDVTDIVASTPSTPPALLTTGIDGAFTYNTNGSYQTINENLNNGFEVQIISGGGDLLLTGAQTASLRINNSSEQINIINGNFSKTLYLANAYINLVNTRIDTTNNYAIDVSSHVQLYVDKTSYVRSQSGYASAIIVNLNQSDISFLIDGVVESNQQAIGVDNGAKVDSIIVNGKLISSANYGLVAVGAGEIGYVEFSSTSEAINPAGIAVYAAAANGKIGDIVLNGVIDTRVIVTTGAVGKPATAGNITLNNRATVRSGAFYLNGPVASLTITAQASINQLTNNYGILYTREATSIDKFDVLGDITASYLIVDSYAASHIKEVTIDPVGINGSDVITSRSMLWVSGHIDSLTISPKVFQVDGMDAPFNFRQTAVIDSMIVNQSIIDTDAVAAGILFNNQAGSNIAALQFNDTLLFGEANNVSVAGQPLTHVLPTILTSNLHTANGVTTLDVEVPELATLPNVSSSGIKLSFLFDDYSHQEDFMYYGGVQTVTIPSSVINTAQPFCIVNYASYDLQDDVVITSNRSQSYEVASYLLSFNLNGGDGQAPQTQQLVEGAFASPVDNPVRAGYTFKGWNTKANGTGQVWTFATSTMPAENLVLYAQWVKIELPQTGDDNAELLFGAALLLSSVAVIIIKKRS
ncbi:InlB B-repeat-containing protein [Culicoidibacter larvae]|uniref:LPXTG cell wall anchor domain-containing protein n=1 Tax=Culicoidibacter larvae TaxID=2579976 RepID=A0A5R8QFQ5_9FIRM|nr:InlB B-repeat-containing protein [Culicoidibacter larvae]TLG75499.1 LPXTG cell wall anchor domain-containing protein [Culicoidibacter larvae]